MSDPATERTIPAMAVAAVTTYGDAEALVDGDVRLSFLEMGHRAQQAAYNAIASGVTPGDRVAIWAPNVWQWVVAALGRFGGRRCPGADQHPVQGRRGAVHHRQERRQVGAHRR